MFAMLFLIFTVVIMLHLARLCVEEVLREYRLNHKPAPRQEVRATLTVPCVQGC